MAIVIEWSIIVSPTLPASPISQMHHFQIRTQQPVKSGWCLNALIAVVVCVSGCAVTPPPAASKAAPAVQPLDQYMLEAKQANANGGKERSRDIYRTAAKTYPTSKEPWLKLAEDYFEANNYGQAILASQEVLQRDPGDSVASSVLAVSGLRVSAAALSMLRQQQSTLNGGARSEAEDLAKVLRDVLGEPVLVPGAATGARPATGSGRRSPTARPLAAATGTAAAASSPTPAPPKSAPAKSNRPPSGDTPPANPFETLKK